MKLFIYPYKQGSSGAKVLAEALDAKRIKTEGSRFRQSRNKLVINWGASSLNVVVDINRILNKPSDVAIASNKLDFFQSLEQGSPIPEYTSFIYDASQWIREGHSVCCRTILNGHSGNGLVLADTEDQLVEAPLYTKYVKKKDEYRIHCFKNKEGDVEVFHQQRKAKRADAEHPNWRIRNHANGFNFVMGSCNPPDAVVDAAKRVFFQTGLDFGAVDVGYNERNDEAVVYEINTAPGLEGTTLERYVEMFGRLI